ncbi:hypothetical protein LMG33818_000394 [Halomonadaceae bacterium LMG 33818]
MKLKPVSIRVSTHVLYECAFDDTDLEEKNNYLYCSNNALNSYRSLNSYGSLNSNSTMNICIH